jgi:arginine exporter protein ArgO
LVAGIVLVNLFWATCAIAGIGVVFAAFPWAALIVKVLGAAYLMWFGFRLLLKAGKRESRSINSTSSTSTFGNADQQFSSGSPVRRMVYAGTMRLDVSRLPELATAAVRNMLAFWAGFRKQSPKTFCHRAKALSASASRWARRIM